MEHGQFGSQDWNCPQINMGKIVVAENGQIRKIEDVEFAEKIIDLKNKKDSWAVIDELIKHWAEKAPDEEQALQINVGQYREQIKDKKFGQTLLGQDQERRFKLAFPYTLHQMIKSIYKDEIQFDEKFFEEFAKRYPAFRVAEQ